MLASQASQGASSSSTTLDASSPAARFATTQILSLTCALVACGGLSCSAPPKRTPQPSGPGSSILGPAGGLRVVGLSFTGLLGLVSGAPPFLTLLSAPSNAACCCSCAPPRCHPGPCRSQHHLPSPGRPAASISTLLTHPSAARASFLPSLCALCAGHVRRLQRPLWLRGRLGGWQKQRAP